MPHPRDAVHADRSAADARHDDHDHIIAAAAAVASTHVGGVVSTIPLLLSLAIVVCLGILGARLADRVQQAPMLGMLLFGVLARNLMPAIVLPLPHSWTAPLWTAALSAVVARAGLSLKVRAIAGSLAPVLMLGIIPVICEATFLSSLVRYVFGLPVPWSFALAFGVASISPGVVVPLVLNLLDQPSWRESRLPPMLLASTGLDVLVATTCFGVSVAAVFGHKHETTGAAGLDAEQTASGSLHTSWLARGFEEVASGVFGGCMWGAIAFFLMRAKVPERFATWIMFAFTTAGMIYGKTSGFPGAASSSVIISWAFVGNLWDDSTTEMANIRLKMVWRFAEPFLFPLIGASVSLIEIPPVIMLSAVFCVSLSMVVRVIVAFVTSWTAGLSVDESMFTCGLIAGKASVQAALSTVTIEALHRYGLTGTDEDAHSRIVFACMVTAIMLGAPFAASWVSMFGGMPRGKIAHVLEETPPVSTTNSSAAVTPRLRRRSSTAPYVVAVEVDSPKGDQKA